MTTGRGGGATTDSTRDLLYGARVTVTDRPSSLAAIHRPAWRVPVTALLVDACRLKKAKREQLIVLNWAVRSERCAAALAAFLKREADSHDVAVRYEPALVRAVNIGVGTGLLTANDDWMHLTDAGRVLIDDIAEQGLYTRERQMLSALPKPLPLNAAEQLLKGGA